MVNENKKTTANTRYVHWLADPVRTGQAMHSAGFAPAFTPLAVGLFNERGEVPIPIGGSYI